MPVPQTNLNISHIWWEIYRTPTPGNVTLEHLVLNSRLSNKSKPYNMGDFRGYDGTPTITMQVLHAHDTNFTQVSANFNKSFSTLFPTTVYYTIDKKDGFAPTMQPLVMQGQETVSSVDFSADRRQTDYQVSVTLNYCVEGYSTTVTQNVTVPAKVAVESQAYTRGKNDAQYDNLYNPDFGMARPQNWGYYSPSQEYTDYMNGYNNWRMMQT